VCRNVSVEQSSRFTHYPLLGTRELNERIIHQSPRPVEIADVQHGKLEACVWFAHAGLTMMSQSYILSPARFTKTEQKNHPSIALSKSPTRSLKRLKLTVLIVRLTIPVVHLNNPVAHLGNPSKSSSRQFVDAHTFFSKSKLLHNSLCDIRHIRYQRCLSF